MRHQEVIDNFVREGRGGLGTYVRANEDLLYSRIPENYRPFGHYQHVSARETPLAVRLADGGILANGSRMDYPMWNHQNLLLQVLDAAQRQFGVVPFDSIVAAWTGGDRRAWAESPIPIKDLQQEVGIVVPSTGERWREVIERDKYGRETKRTVHTLGDSVIRVQDRFYVSAVDATGRGAGMYFLAELLTDRPPASFEDALNVLKPQVVREAEARGAYVKRQGEWFAVPTKARTSELLGDVERGMAVHRTSHVLGRDGHHQLEEAVIYRVGPRKGEVYARGVVQHTGGEHEDLDLGTIRWHLMVHNIQGASYTLRGANGAQFD